MPIFVIGVIVIIGSIVTWFASEATEAQERANIAKSKFMTACKTDRKEYECTVMWMSATKQDVVPVFIPIYTGR